MSALIDFVVKYIYIYIHTHTHTHIHMHTYYVNFIKSLSSPFIEMAEPWLHISSEGWL